MTLKTDVTDLLDRLRWLQQVRADALNRAARDERTAVTALDQANGLLDSTDPRVLRAALLHATQPGGGQPPISVVLGPQDAAAATVGVDEVMALANVHLQAVLAVVRGEGPVEQADTALHNLRGAVELLALAAVGAEVGRSL